MTITRAELIAAARAETWRQGCAYAWALDEGQQAWRESFLSSPPLSSTVWLVGRQRGKTHAAVYLALELGLTKKGAIIRYCAKTKDSAVGIVGPAWRALCESMPPEVRPVQGRNEYEWTFPSTGAVFVLFGTDSQSFAKGRGPRTDLQLLDEVGFFQDLPAVEAALLPSLQTTGGRVLYLSTPAESVGHAYTARVYAAQAAGRCVHDTFWSNPRVDHEAVIEAERQRLGMEREAFLGSTYFRREYLAEIVTDESRAALPAWTRERAAQLVGEWTRPVYFDGYVSIDPGRTGDPHAALWAFYDPSTSTVTVERELELRSAAHTVKAWADAMKGIEAELYGEARWEGTLLGAADWSREFGGLPEYLQTAISDRAPRQPYLRVGDNDGAVLNTLNGDHGLAVIPTPKAQKHLAVDTVNQLVATGRVRIHRRCVRLIEQLYSTVWNRTRGEWERTDKDHGDLVDCLVYLCRNVRWHRDCRPPPVGDQFKMPEHLVPQQEKRGAAALRGVLAPRR